MKKLHLLKTMLLLCALIVGNSSVWADTVTFSHTDYKEKGTESSGSAYTMEKEDVSIDDTKFYGNNSYAHFYANGVSTITPASGVTITGIELTASSTKYNGFQSSGTVTPSIGSMSHEGTTVTWTGSATSAFTISHNKQIRWTSIVVTYTKAPSYTITAVSNNNSWGTVSGTTTITATPADGYRVKAGTEGYTVTEGTATVTNNGNNTFSVSPSTNCTIQINFEEIPTHAVTFSNPTGGMVTVKNGDDAIVSGDEIREGTELTLIASPGPGKKFTSWTVTGATPADDSAATTTLTVGTSDISIAAILGDATTHPIHWSVNGSVEETSNVIEGEAIVFPSSISGIPSGYTLKGWSATEIITPQTTAPSYVTEATCTEEKTYYAVFARGVASSASLTKMGTGDTFAANDKIVVVAVIDKDTSYGLYQETISSSYVKNFEFDGEVSTIAADNKNWWTVSAGSTNGTWKLGDSTNGFLYNGSSNNLTADKDNSSDWTLIDNEDGSFKLEHSRYLSCRSDLDTDNKYKFRMAGSNPAGVYSLDIYKYTPAGTVDTDYRTKLTYATATITAAEYATFVSSYATDFSETGITVYTATDNTTYVKLNEVAGGQVPANTPVVLYKAGADGSAIDVPVIASADPVASNDLSVVGAGGLSGEDGVYVLAKKDNGVGFYLWDNSVTLNEGKVCLRTGGSSARDFLGFDEGETTSLREIRNEELGMKNAEYFNLNGQRVAQPTKGLYIVNGRKVVIK